VCTTPISARTLTTNKHTPGSNPSHDHDSNSVVSLCHFSSKSYQHKRYIYIFSIIIEDVFFNSTCQIHPLTHCLLTCFDQSYLKMYTQNCFNLPKRPIIMIRNTWRSIRKTFTRYPAAIGIDIIPGTISH